MVSRSRSGSFDSYMSPAERAYTDYLFNNRRTLLTGEAGAEQGSKRAGPWPAAAQPSPQKPRPPQQQPMLPAIPDLPFARFAGGKVVQGPAGSMRTYRLGDRAFLVPSGAREGDIVAGVNYVALDAKSDVTFATDPSGRGLIALDQAGQPVNERGAPAAYSWERLQELGKFGIIPREKWTAERPKTAQDKPDFLGELLGDHVDPLKPQTKAYSMITLHHTGDHTAESVMRLHLNKIPSVERIARKVGSQLGLAQSYDEYADVGYHFLIDDNGRIYEGRSIKSKGAHVTGHNSQNLGIAVLGDYSSRPLNLAQLRAIEFLAGTMKRRLGIAPNQRGGGELANSGFLYTHGEFSPAKRDELKGAQEQLNELSRKLQGSYR